MEATHKISAVFYERSQNLEVTWENLEDGTTASLLTFVPIELGQKISRVVMPCVYSGAISRPQPDEVCEWQLKYESFGYSEYSTPHGVKRNSSIIDWIGCPYYKRKLMVNK